MFSLDKIVCRLCLFRRIPEKVDVSRLPLSLSAGDFVKLKMFSSDMCVAFGYQKNGRFSFKKWGFIYTDTIMDDSEDAESDPEMDSTTTESTNKLL
ncbi:hypothetical protein DPMN_058498 [Dreissena polymorpha]|uniref:Uncharacterized protein n=1 Tax=Dreissena polymorpha TaxID=45954 RepID=A0A9D4C255_DREPO|nr:hypothetical protein DPMN_058498 [Dreissena polymorpha]